MITSAQTKKLQRLIKNLVQAEIADSWKGGGDLADIPIIEAELLLAKSRLAQYLLQLQIPKPPIEDTAWFKQKEEDHNNRSF